MPKGVFTMLIRNPMHWLDAKHQKKGLITLLILVLTIFFIFRLLDVPLQTEAAPNGIISFELAGTPEKANRILSSWDSHANLFAAFGLGFDYLFMLVYAFSICLASLMVSRKHTGWFSSLGAWIGWSAFFAAFMDAIENFALWNMLARGSISSWPAIASWCASIKFIILICGIVYGLVGWVLPRKRI
jgi:hypothetical protein